jgi:hypothetical protein
MLSSRFAWTNAQSTCQAHRRHIPINVLVKDADAATGEEDLAAPAGHKAKVSHVFSQIQALPRAVGNESGYHFVSAQSDQAEVEKQLGIFFFDRGGGGARKAVKNWTGL